MFHEKPVDAFPLSAMVKVVSRDTEKVFPLESSEIISGFDAEQTMDAIASMTANSSGFLMGPNIPYVRQEKESSSIGRKEMGVIGI